MYIIMIIPVPSPHPIPLAERVVDCSLPNSTPRFSYREQLHHWEELAEGQQAEAVRRRASPATLYRLRRYDDNCWRR